MADEITREFVAENQRRLQRQIRESMRTLNPAFKLLKRQMAAFIHKPTPARARAIANAFRVAAPGLDNFASHQEELERILEMCRGELNA